MKKKKDEEKRKKRKYDKMKLVEFVLNENDADVGVFAISLVEDPAIEENFIVFLKIWQASEVCNIKR